MTASGNLEAVVRAWAQLEAAYGEAGPWVRSLPSGGVRPLHLDPL